MLVKEHLGYQGGLDNLLSASPRFQELANFPIVTGVARAADLQSLTVFELKLPAAGVRGGADTATFAEQLRDFGGILLHVAAANQACHHGGITSIIVSSLYVSMLIRMAPERFEIELARDRLPRLRFPRPCSSF